MAFRSLMRSAYHFVTGVSDGKGRSDFVPFTERNNSPEALKLRDTHLREKYLWKAKKTGWGAGGSATVFATETEALAEAERLETAQERLN